MLETVQTSMYNMALGFSPGIGDSGLMSSRYFTRNKLCRLLPLQRPDAAVRFEGLSNLQHTATDLQTEL
jgi:hypothetical protein